jgi:hypothetical protein
MTTREYAFAFSQHDMPEVCMNILSPRRERGMPGARCTRGLVCKMHEKLRTRAYRFSGEHPASPAQWLYGLCRDLLGDEFVFVTVTAGLTAIRSGRIEIATDSLASATDAGTTRFCRTQQRRSSVRRASLTENRPATTLRADAAASTASHPAFVTMANAPLAG